MAILGVTYVRWQEAVLFRAWLVGERRRPDHMSEGRVGCWLRRGGIADFCPEDSNQLSSAARARPGRDSACKPKTSQSLWRPPIQRLLVSRQYAVLLPPRLKLMPIFHPDCTSRPMFRSRGRGEPLTEQSSRICIFYIAKPKVTADFLPGRSMPRSTGTRTCLRGLDPCPFHQDLAIGGSFRRDFG